MIVAGTITKQLDDGSEAHADWMLDTETGQIVQVGGEAHITAEEIDLIKGMSQIRTDEEGNLL